MALPGLKWTCVRTGTVVAIPVRGFRAWRPGRPMVEDVPKPRISTRSPFASASLTRLRMVRTTASLSSVVRCGFCWPTRAMSSDRIIGTRWRGHYTLRKCGGAPPPASTAVQPLPCSDAKTYAELNIHARSLVLV
jgi:hypothetical protein